MIKVNNHTNNRIKSIYSTKIELRMQESQNKIERNINWIEFIITSKCDGIRNQQNSPLELVLHEIVQS